MGIFFFGFCVPFLLQLFIIRHVHMVVLCNALCFVTQSIFFVIELIQMTKLGIRTYFEGTQNKIDVVLFLTTYIYIFMRINNPDREILPNTNIPA